MLGTIGVLVMSIVAGCGMSLYALAKTNQDLNTLYEQRTRPVAWLGEIYGLQLQNIQMLDRALSIQSAAATSAATEQLAANRPALQQRMNDWDSIIVSDEGRRLHDEITQSRAGLVAASDEA